MEILERAMLRREGAMFQQKYALSVLKLNYYSQKARNVSFRDGDFLAQKTIANNPSAHSIQLENKQLYLKYVEQVLTAKQQQLLQLEEHLNQRRLRLEESQGQLKAAYPVSLNLQADLIANKIASMRQLAVKLAGCKSQSAVNRQLDEFQHQLYKIEQTCRKSSEKVSNDFLNEFKLLQAERQEVQKKKSKLQELQSYQKYLNELQNALESKEYEIIMKQKEIRQLSLAFCESNSQTNSMKNQFNTYQDENPNDHSIRKRARIFQPRLSSQQGVVAHKESSKIMQQNSTNDYTKQTTQKNSKEVENQQKFNLVVNAGIQTLISCKTELNSGLVRINCERLSFKFIKLWVKFSDRAGKGGVNHQKCMNLYLWRLNALYDEQAKKKIEKLLSWPKKVEKIWDLQTIDYKDLSLKKKKYIETFFNFQQKNFHRKKIMSHIYSVIKNKNRRERTAIYIFFHKYRRNTEMIRFMKNFQANRGNILVEKSANLFEVPKKEPPKIQNSKLLNNSSSNSGQVKAIKQDHSRGKLSNTSKATPSVATSKTRLFSKEQGAIDIPRLKQYIKNQQEVQARLAVECAQTQAAFKICGILSNSLQRSRVKFFVNSLRLGQTTKLNNLQKAINSWQFKWQLFMAKARVGLTNNTNKIAHLQQLINFM